MAFGNCVLTPALSTTARLHSHGGIRAIHRVRWARDARSWGCGQSANPSSPPGPRRGAGGARHPPSHGPGAASRPGRVFSPARPPNRQNVRQEAQGQMRRPPSPRAPFVIAPAQGRLARLDAGCSRPAPAAPPDQPGPRGVRRGMAPSGLQCPSPHLPPPDQPALRPRQPSADGAHPPRDASGPARPLATFLTGLPRPPDETLMKVALSYEEQWPIFSNLG